MKKYLLALLPVFVLLAGCLGDSNIGPQVFIRPIFPPGQVYYTCIAPTTLQLRWNPPLVDTQLNFKGYFIELFTSARPSDSTAIIDSTVALIDSVHVPKIDTMCIFSGKVGQSGRYTVKVWGERYPSLSKPDSLVLSLGPAQISFTYDANPVLKPTAIFASSAGSTMVNLFWSRSPSDTNVGMAGYIIRFQDTTHLNAPIQTLQTRIPKNTNLVGNNYWQQVSIPGNTAPPVELPFKYWVKAVRQDSVESGDSVEISWSGAEIIPPGPIPVKQDTALFLGQQGFGYNMVQVAPSDANNAYMQVSLNQSTSQIVITGLKPTGGNTTQFAGRIDTATTFNNNFFAAPFLGSDFNSLTASFPSTVPPNSGKMIYALLPGGTRARILFVADSTGSFFRASDNTVEVQASFQPITTLPFF